MKITRTALTCFVLSLGPVSRERAEDRHRPARQHRYWRRHHQRQ